MSVSNTDLSRNCILSDSKQELPDASSSESVAIGLWDRFIQEVDRSINKILSLNIRVCVRNRHTLFGPCVTEKVLKFSKTSFNVIHVSINSIFLDAEQKQSVEIEADLKLSRFTIRLIKPDEKQVQWSFSIVEAILEENDSKAGEISKKNDSKADEISKKNDTKADEILEENDSDSGDKVFELKATNVPIGRCGISSSLDNDVNDDLFLQQGNIDIFVERFFRGKFPILDEHLENVESVIEK